MSVISPVQSDDPRWQSGGVVNRICGKAKVLAWKSVTK